jgi:hypothetical protein
MNQTVQKIKIFIQTNKKLLFIILCLVIIFNTVNTKEGYKSALTFDNTQKWGSEEIRRAMDLSEDNKQILKRMPIISPPKNNSNETKGELKDLLIKQKQRTSAQQEEIIKERSLSNCVKKFAKNVEEEKILSDFIQTTVQPVSLALKHHYNRVRPTFLEPKLKSTIPIPPHASYPSGHATEAHVMAHLMSEKYPNQREGFFTKAEEIATNRERAGVHYRSDTEYGKKLAKKIFEVISKARMNPFKLR